MVASSTISTLTRMCIRNSKFLDISFRRFSIAFSLWNRNNSIIRHTTRNSPNVMSSPNSFCPPPRGTKKFAFSVLLRMRRPPLLHTSQTFLPQTPTTGHVSKLCFTLFLSSFRLLMAGRPSSIPIITSPLPSTSTSPRP